MRERAELLGGAYVVCSAPGKGTRISVTWPLAAQKSAGSGEEDETRAAPQPIVTESGDGADALRGAL
jgi:hypothetical protein